MNSTRLLIWFCSFFCAVGSIVRAADNPEQWRKEKRLIDLHLHINYTEDHLNRAVRILNKAGIGVGVNLSGGAVTAQKDGIIPFQKNKELADKLHPGRFIHYLNLDYTGWDEPGFAEKAVAQIETGHKLGAAGLKEFKRLGLYLKDKQGQLIKVDDARLDGVWKRCGELNMPISIHVADPKAFWEPYNEKNERWTELKDHPNWWFGDRAKYPTRAELLAALSRVIARHPKTKFVAVHFANNAEDLEWVEQQLDKYPNMMADLAARVPEAGRHDPAKVRRLFEKHQDRIVFATDFQVYNTLTLGSGGSGPAPTDDDANSFFSKHWRWLETNDENFEHMTPIQGEWTISAIGLKPDVLRKIYFDNAAKLLAASIPKRIEALRTTDMDMLEALKDEPWEKCEVSRIEFTSKEVSPKPGSTTVVRTLYSDKFLYVRYDALYTELTTFEPPRLDSERIGLWDRDVVELFLGTDFEKITDYYEFQVAPTNEKLDLFISKEVPLVQERIGWNSGFESAIKNDTRKYRWTSVMKIPLKPLKIQDSNPGLKARLNFYRIDKVANAYIAWSPTLDGSYHKPERFGTLWFK